MTKCDEALEILEALGLPRAQRNERSALVLLALASIKPRMRWRDCQQPLLRIWDIMRFMRENYDKDYAANTRETIRRQTIHQFEQARIVNRNPDDPARPTNSRKSVYALTDDAAAVLKSFGTRRFVREVDAFVGKYDRLVEAYNRRREMHAVRLHLPTGAEVLLSPGKHNRLQVQVIEEFGPRFAPGAMVLYFGDTARKHVLCDADKLWQLGVPITEHDKLPDVVLFQQEKNWLFLVEAVTSHGPVDPKRHAAIEAMMAACAAGRIYVTAFADRASFRRHAAAIAWETEVWIADAPDHLIHFNGLKFLGPYPMPRQ
jgi:hypothetical protein